MGCKLCYRDEPGNVRNSELLVCSRCLQVIANSTQDRIKAAYALAAERGFMGKAEVLGKFIIPEEELNAEPINTRRKPTEYRYGERTFEIDRAYQGAAGRITQSEAASVSASD